MKYIVEEIALKYKGRRYEVGSEIELQEKLAETLSVRAAVQEEEKKVPAGDKPEGDK